MLSRLDQCVGDVVSALGERGMLNNSIIIFSTDNGGPAAGFNLNAASNWPLRGVQFFFLQNTVAYSF
jgi:arylsulfatase A-like enzyme